MSFPKSVDPGPAVPATAGRLLEMQILELFPRPTKSGILGVGHSSICFNNPPGDFNAQTESHHARKIANLQTY